MKPNHQSLNFADLSLANMLSGTDELIAQYKQRTSKPLIVAGNGPSLASIEYQRIPSDFVLFRSNWFFLENSYYLGADCDGFFWTIDNAPLYAALVEQLALRNYSIRQFFSPLSTSYAERTVSSTTPDSMKPKFDHWSIIARVPAFSRFLASRPLPTQGMQMLMCGLALGFTEIHLTGIDFYSSSTVRYAYEVPDDIKSTLSQKDIEPGYERAHSLDVDLRALELCLRLYPNTKIYRHSAGSPLENYVPLAPIRPDFAAHLPLAKEGQFARRISIASSGALRSASAAIPEMNNKHGAYATYCDSSDYWWGVLALSNSLRRVSPFPLLVMTPRGFQFGHQSPPDNVFLVECPEVTNPNTLPDRQQRFRSTYCKLNVFNLIGIDTVVFLDADAIVLKSLDELFRKEGFHACPDVGDEYVVDRFNSGVFVCHPSRATFDDMLLRLRELKSYDGGDQGFLNNYFPAWSRLPTEYNTLKRVYRSFPALFQLTEIKVLHFVGVKPWMAKEPDEFAALERLWFEALAPADLMALLRSSLRRSSSVADEGLVFARELLRGAPAALTVRVDDWAIRNRGKLTTSQSLRQLAEIAIAGNYMDLARSLLRAARKKRPEIRNITRRLLSTYVPVAALRNRVARPFGKSK